MRTFAFPVILISAVILTGCDSELDKKVRQIQKEADELKSKIDSTQVKIDSARKEMDTILKKYGIDTAGIRLDSTFKKINPLK